MNGNSLNGRTAGFPMELGGSLQRSVLWMLALVMVIGASPAGTGGGLKTTMPVVIFRLLGQPGASNYGQALAMSVILMAVCAVAFVTIERLRVGGVGEF